MITATSHLNGLLKMFEQVLLLGLFPKHHGHRLVELTNYQGQHLHKVGKMELFAFHLHWILNHKNAKNVVRKSCCLDQVVLIMITIVTISMMTMITTTKIWLQTLASLALLIRSLSLRSAADRGIKRKSWQQKSASNVKQLDSIFGDSDWYSCALKRSCSSSSKRVLKEALPSWPSHLREVD